MIKRCYLEITNACNLNCPFCTNDKGNDYMALKDVNNYLKQIKEVTNYVYLHVLGEPLLHKDINNIFDTCDQLGLNAQLVTNGIFLSKHLDLLKHSSLRKISISIHSINNLKVENEYFDTLDFIIENMNKYIELRFYNSDNLDMNIKNYLSSLYKRYNVSDVDRFNSYKLKENVYIKYDNLFKWPDINDKFISNNGFCHGGIDQIAILHNGDVTLCCLDPYGHNKIGNLKNESLKSILDSNNYKNIIQNFRNKMLSKELCTKCSYRLRFDDKNS